MSKPYCLIGIDFGTTHCTLAFHKIGEGVSEIQQFAIPQLMSPATLCEQHLLPSFLFFPPKEELDNHAASLVWDKSRQYCVGKFAQERGGELPLQLVASSKSWLCHSGINRRDPLLPLHWESAESKVSPLQASSYILQHLREAWEYIFPERSFAEQEIYITVPASFDPAARQLVLEAAQLAKYPEVILLEEPQAAFYAWLQSAGDEWRKGLQVGDRLLVIDIGGGTTDFSLISIGEKNGDLELNRLAVGAHLLLGGDNIDLTLAHLAKSKLEEMGHEIDEWQMQGVVQACRRAKENLLGENPADSFDITVMGRGSRLIGGSLSVTLAKEEVLTMVLEGFFPFVEASEQSKIEQRSGMQQIGLPFAQDPRITAHLAKFLSQEGEGSGGSTEQFIVPKAVLFNGGSTKSEKIRQRLIEQLNLWAENFHLQKVRELPHADYDYAVSRGAVFYGLARQGKAIRIRSGTSRSYYIGVEEAIPAVPGMAIPLKAVCVVPYGMEEGSELTLSQQKFALVLGERATFRFFSRSTERLPDGALPEIGTIVKRWRQELTELNPLEVLLDKSDSDGKTIQVQLHSKVTELGVFELWCVAEDGRKWKLEFDIRL